MFGELAGPHIDHDDVLIFVEQCRPVVHELRGKRLGFTLSEISRLLELYDSPTGTIAQLRAFLDTIAEHRAVLERQLEDLNATLAELAAYETQGRVLLSANAEKRAFKMAAGAGAGASKKSAKAI